MLFSFKHRFVPLLLDGSKTHTIRALRKDGKVAKVGETAHCFMNARQKSMTLLGRWTVARVEEFEVYTRGDGTLAPMVDGEVLSLDEKNALAYRDGFRSEDPFLEMTRYWLSDLRVQGKIIGICVTKKCKPLEPKVVEGEGINFVGHITHWKFDPQTRNPNWPEILARLETTK